MLFGLSNRYAWSEYTEYTADSSRQLSYSWLIVLKINVNQEGPAPPLFFFPAWNPHGY